ncbi:hypothetical protein G6F40_015690 [Rhizopus arrhizus]|nr:hypothetical protein G6F40_015690 [Rhizopus arrhizus]
MEDTFRPPWFHRNVASEFMGQIQGVYDAKAAGFAPGGARLHNCMSGHGPAQAAYDAAGRAALGMFGMAVLGLALWVVQRSPLGTWLALLLAIPSVVFSLAGALLDRSALLTTAQLLESLLYFYTAGALIAYMLQDHKVTRDELFAAGATFTLLAWAVAARARGRSAAGWNCFI